MQKEHEQEIRRQSVNIETLKKQMASETQIKAREAQLEKLKQQF